MIRSTDPKTKKKETPAKVEPSASPLQPAEPPEPVLETSVLIVSHNCAPALRRCLAALEKSHAKETTEILVVDCGSVDESAQIDSEFPGVTVLRLPRNFGRTKARNIGVRTAKGEFLLFLEPHVEVRPDTVPALVACLQEESEVAVACPMLVDAGGASVSEAGKLPSPSELAALWRAGEPGRTRIVDPGAEPIRVEYPSTDAVMVRRQFVKGMNYFDERYGEFGSDLELFTQVRKAPKRAVILPSVRVTCNREGVFQLDSTARACLSADQALGSAVYVRKHYGWWSGLQLRLRIILMALGLVLGFSDLGYRFGVLSRVVRGEKVDGFQTGI